MLGIITALTTEAHCFSKEQKRRSTQQLIKLNNQCLLYISGVGANQATRAAAELINRGATSLLSWGTAGALATHLQAGDVIIPTHSLTQDQQRYTMTPTWQQRLYQHAHTLGGTVHQGPLLHSDTTIQHCHYKQQLFNGSGAIAVDMETAAIAAFAATRQIPMACIRVIVDPAHFNLPQLATCAINAEGQIKWVPILWNLMRYPYEWQSVYQLTRFFKRAKHSLQQLANLPLTPELYV